MNVPSELDGEQDCPVRSEPLRSSVWAEWDQLHCRRLSVERNTDGPGGGTEHKSLARLAPSPSPVYKCLWGESLMCPPLCKYCLWLHATMTFCKSFMHLINIYSSAKSLQCCGPLFLVIHYQREAELQRSSCLVWRNLNSFRLDGAAGLSWAKKCKLCKLETPPEVDMTAERRYVPWELGLSVFNACK